MATRGIYGFRKNNYDKLNYNHFNSFPSGLGVDIVFFIKSHSLEEINKLCDELIPLPYDTYFEELSPEQKNMMIEFAKEQHEDFEGKKLSYMLAPFEGNLEAYYDYPQVRLMRDDKEFIKNSLSCEWGYIINLDNNTLEIWQGFQSEPDITNRYGVEIYYQYETSNYYPCKLIKEYKLENIKTDKFSLQEFKRITE